MAEKLKQGLSSEHFAHPLDRSGMQRLMDHLTNSVAKNQVEKLQADAEEEFYLFNLADNTRLSESQGGSVYGLVQEIAGILGMPGPDVFLDTTPQINAYALSGMNPTIVLTSTLIDTFPEPALRQIMCQTRHKI